jgi:uncharacterized protein (TIGR03435 family)
LLWLSASVKFLVPFALLTAVGAQIPWPLRPIQGTEPSFFSIAGQVVGPITRFGGGGATAVAEVTHAAGHGSLMVIAVGMLWGVGTLAMAVHWFRRWRLVHRALGESTATSLPFVIPVRSSSSQLEPAVVGVVRPVLLLPKGLEQRLIPAEMCAVLAHERCHVVWRDNLAASLHMFVEALFWFHPLIWWLGMRLVEERERACDEHVLSEGHSPANYAEGILKVCEHYLEPRLACVAGISGASLRRRIDAIMRNTLAERLSVVRKLLITVAACGTIAVPIAIGALTSSHAHAQAQVPAPDELSFRNLSIEVAPGRGAIPVGGSCFGIGLVSYDRVAIGCSSLRDFIADVYGVAESQVVGQDWSKIPDYRITADDPVRSAQDRAAAFAKVPAMMRNLLTTRFGLVVRQERRQLDGYVLTISSGGSKLRPYGGGPSWKTSFWMTPQDGIDVTDYPVGALVAFLQHMYRVPVVDRTGLQGHYEYRAVWKAPPPGTLPDPATVAQALDEQAGLRLEAGPVTVEVINVISLKSPEEVVTHDLIPNFKDADIAQVAEAVGGATHKNFIVDPRVHARVSMYNSKPMSPEEFYQAFLGILRTQGFVAMQVGDVIKILPDSNGR